MSSITLRPRFSLPLCLYLLLSLFAQGCSREKPASAAKGGSAAPQVVAVTVAPVEAKDVQRRVEVVGTLQPDEEVTVYAKVSGYVEKIRSEERRVGKECRL